MTVVTRETPSARSAPAASGGELAVVRQLLREDKARVGEFASTHLLSCPPDTSLARAAELMRERACSSILVVEDGRALGIWTERDATRVDFSEPAVFDRPVSSVMSAPVHTIRADTEVPQALMLLEQSGIRHLVVVDEAGKAAGIVTQTDLVLRYGVEHFLRLRTVAEVGGQPLLRLPAELSVAEAATRLRCAGCDAALVERADGVPGILTERDLIRLVAARQTGATLQEVASFPLRTVPADWSLLEARRLLVEGHIRHLGIAAEDGGIAGLLCLHDILHLLQRSYQADLIEALHERDRALMRVREDLSLARQVIDSSVNALMIIDAGGVIRSVNPAFSRVTGYGGEEALGRRPDELIFAGSAAPDLCAALCAQVDREGPWRGHVWGRDKAGAARAYSISLHAVSSEGRAVGCYAASFYDETEKVCAEEQLRLAASVFSCATEGILITDAAGTIVDVNDAFCRITGYGRREVVGRNPRMLSSGRQDARFYAAMWQHLEQRGHWSGELWNRRKDGGEYAQFLTIGAVPDASGRTTHYVGLFSDITRQKNHQLELERIAHYDPLTGLPNRVLLADRLAMVLARCRRSGGSLAVCVMDLDGFKPVNDSLGHEAGDLLLQEVAARLRAAVREEDTVARLGGDEFVLLLDGVRGDCEALLQRLVASIGTPIAIGGRTVRVSASIGVTLFPEDPSEPDLLLRHADQAMYVAKSQGKNRFHLFDPAAESRLRASRRALARIEEAVAQRELVLHYQPKVDCRRGRVVGAEALLRWNHPEDGLKLPSEFLDELEQAETVERLGNWVIAEVLAQAAAWEAEGLRLPLSFNVSARQLLDGRLADHMLALLAQHPPELARRLTIEVVETAALEDVQTVCRIMARLQPLGIAFSLDDFGTGYSTLLHLKQLPADELKIASAFVRDMLGSAGDLAIVEGVAGLARAFGRVLVAEGVEQAEQVRALLALGCDVVQGHLIAPAMPADALVRWLAGFRPDPRWHAENAPAS